MSPEDPRHGTMRGFKAGCREMCCRRGYARYEKRRRLNAVSGTSLAVPAIGVQRRVQALMSLGWTTTDIAHAAGWTHRNRVAQLLSGQKGRPCRWVERSTYDTIARIYSEWCMTIPEQTEPRRRSRQRVLALGYLPPLSWDDIDDPDERPKGLGDFDGVDHVAVERVLAGEWHYPLTRDEKVLAVEQWRGSDAELERHTGWNVARMRRQVRGAA